MTDFFVILAWLCRFKFKFICSEIMGWWEKPRLRIVQPVSPCIAMVEGGLPIAYYGKQVSYTEI